MEYKVILFDADDTLFDFKNTAVSINAQNSPVVIPVTAAAQIMIKIIV
mgnify:CR=1 FL=1